MSRPHFTADLLFAFSCLGTLLAVIGVYGLLTCPARAQIREIALRQALGGQRVDIFSYMMEQAIRLVLPGLLAGLALALIGNRLIANLLFHVKPNDPEALIVVCAA